MKGLNIFLASILAMGMGVFSACDDELDVVNPNQQTTATFGETEEELEECVIACYNHTRIEGCYARVGYTLDVCRGDEVWNSSQVWYMPYDDLDVTYTDEIGQWVWRDWYYTINVCNYILARTTGNNEDMSTSMQRIKGQALFFRALGYYNLVTYFQNPPLITDYNDYATLTGLYKANNTFDEVYDQVEADFLEAIDLLPSRDLGGEWSGGRITCGAAAGYYARVLMARHKFSEALEYLKAIINGDYGSYSLMANYGDNFRETSAYENNAESLYEVQFLDYGTQGTDEEWTPVNTSSNATQGHAVESNYCPGDNGGWADLSLSPWLYNLYKEERTKDGGLDPRLYWVAGTYEAQWDSYSDGYGNVVYGATLTDTTRYHTNNINGGIPIAKWTNMRTGLYTTISAGLTGGINLRMMRYSDILLRAAECINEISGPTAEAIGYINQVRSRANLADLQLSDFSSADKLFEQIANVERPKEFAAEFGRGQDLLRWGFFYTSDRLQQLKEHGTFRKTLTTAITDPVSYDEIATDNTCKSTYDTYKPGHEYFPIYYGTLNDNPNLVGNSANTDTDNSDDFFGRGWTVHPVVDLD